MSRPRLKTKKSPLACSCPSDAPAWPECCRPHLLGVVDHNQDALNGEPNREFKDYDKNVIDNMSGKSGSDSTPLPGGGVGQPMGGMGPGDVKAEATKKSSQKLVSQLLTGEFRLTKKILREQTEAYIASEGVVKAAKKILSLLDSDSDKIALAAAKDVLDRVGVGKSKETMEGLIKTQNNGQVPAEWLERIVDEDIGSDESQDS